MVPESGTRAGRGQVVSDQSGHVVFFKGLPEKREDRLSPERQRREVEFRPAGQTLEEGGRSEATCPRADRP